MKRRLPLKALCLVAASALACSKPQEPIDPKARADGEYLAGTAAYLAGDFAQAEKHFAHVKQLNPNEPRLPVAEGELYLSMGKLAEAKGAFERALLLDSKRATTWSRVGAIEAMLGHTAEATFALDRALELNPKDFRALESKAELAQKGGRVDEAVRLLIQSASAAPERLAPELVLRAVAELKRRHRSRDALDVLEEQVRRGVDGPNVQGEYGDLLVEAGRLSDAQQAFRRAAAQDDKDPGWWELVGELEMRQGDLDAAREAFQKSLQVADRALVHVALARLCERRKDSACITRELDSALKAATGEEPREVLELAELLSRVGRRADAFALLAPLADEDEQQANVLVQLQAARVAKANGDQAAVARFCGRVKSSADAGTARCP